MTTNDKREILADNAALMAEISALNTALATEREATSKLVMGYDSALSADAELIERYKQANLILQDTIAAKDKQHATELRAEKAKGWGKTAVGFLAGIVVGVVVAK